MDNYTVYIDHTFHEVQDKFDLLNLTFDNKLELFIDIDQIYIFTWINGIEGSIKSKRL